MPRPVDEPIHMWSYWRDRKGMERAMEEHYPTKADSPTIRYALTQIESAKVLIDKVMEGTPCTMWV